ncbi:MAG: hypothetical protein FJ224_11905 [Lentisphaerae bacterium]|nr:hypothetical protein [Lentisphaerota bacterium]
MRTGRPIVRAAILFAIAAGVLLAAVQVWLSIGLLGHIRRSTLPAASADFGAPIHVAGASGSIFGRLGLDGIRLENPSGFDGEPDMVTVGSFRSRLALLPLFGGNVLARRADISGAEVNIVRNRDGKVNAHLPGRGRGKSEQGSPHAPPEGKAGAPAGRRMETGWTRVLSLHTVAKVTFTDRSAPGGTAAISFDCDVGAWNVGTIKAGPAAGRYRIKAHLAGNPSAFTTEIGGTVGVLSDTDRPDFTATGSVSRIDLALLAPFTGTSDLVCERADMDVSLICRRGVYRQPDSWIRLRLVKPVLRGELARKARGVRLPDEFALTVPVSGAVSAPETDLESAMLRSVLEHVARDPQAVIKSLKADERTARDIENALKAIGGFLQPPQ